MVEVLDESGTRNVTNQTSRGIKEKKWLHTERTKLRMVFIL
jgi:hypothetical protein